MLMGVSSAVLAGVDASLSAALRNTVPGGSRRRLPGRRLFVHFCFGIFSFPAYPGSPGAWVVGWNAQQKFETKLLPQPESDPSACAAKGPWPPRLPAGGQRVQAPSPARRCPSGAGGAMGYMVALVLLNSLLPRDDRRLHQALLLLGKGRPGTMWDCSMVKHGPCCSSPTASCTVPWLSCPSPLYWTSPSSARKSLSLSSWWSSPSCLPNSLYILFNPHFKEDLGEPGKANPLLDKIENTQAWCLLTRRCGETVLWLNPSLGDLHQCQHSLRDLPSGSGRSAPAYPMTESCHLSSVVFVPCL